MAQVPADTPVWSNLAGVQADVTWQESHPSVVGMCVAGLPAAVVPLWQLAQVPSTSTWSTLRAGFHAVVVWQAAQLLVVVM